MNKIVKQTDVLTAFLRSVAPTKGDTPLAVQPELKVKVITATGTTFSVGSKGNKSFVFSAYRPYCGYNICDKKENKMETHLKNLTFRNNRHSCGLVYCRFFRR